MLKFIFHRTFVSKSFLNLTNQYISKSFFYLHLMNEKCWQTKLIKFRLFCWCEIYDITCHINIFIYQRKIGFWLPITIQSTNNHSYLSFLPTCILFLLSLYSLWLFELRSFQSLLCGSICISGSKDHNSQHCERLIWWSYFNF